MNQLFATYLAAGGSIVAIVLLLALAFALDSLATARQTLNGGLK
jgi:hypothetical protein